MKAPTANLQSLPVAPPKAEHWGHLHGSAMALALAEAVRRRERPSVILVPGMREALKLETELSFFLGEAAPVWHFPDWETLPYDQFSPHQDIVSQRLELLYRLPDSGCSAVLVAMSTLMQRLLPQDYLRRNVFLLDRGERLDRDDLQRRLAAAGYRNVSQVLEHGEFAVRGSIVDLFPMASTVPYRIDFFDDEVESIRSFDTESQLTAEQVERVRVLPAREYPLTAEGIAHFRRAWREAFPSESRNSPVYHDVSDGQAPAGIEYYLPLFHEQMQTLFDYLPADTAFFSVGDPIAAATDFQAQLEDRYEQRRHDIERPLLGPSQLFLSPDEVQALLARHRAPQLHSLGAEPDGGFDYPSSLPPPVATNPRLEHPFQTLQAFLDDFDGRVLFLATSAGRREALLEMLRGANLRPQVVDSWQAFVVSDEPLCISVGDIDAGMRLDEAGLAVITEHMLLGEHVSQRRRRSTPTRDAEAVIANLTDLNLGAPVVHIDHGVGRYLGLVRLEVGGLDTEFLALEYAGKDKLYVPVASLQLISRYTGADPDSAPLHRLGGEQWQKIKRKAAEKVRDVAAELLELYARRAARQGVHFDTELEGYRAFAAAFPFEETPDQLSAIEAVQADMASTRPMDRVVCGDVGFGKTEVAMRAAFIAVENGRQVAIPVPTTLLAQQHYQNFRDRFADWPVRVEALSRFQNKKQQDLILRDLADGKVDIIIGTHKLIQKGVKFKNLGLVIIDEEHRFGVRHKEHLKSLRAEVDVLTLTATPIPRTLNMGLAGLRDLSIIATPPAHRHAIKTFVGEWNPATIREACQRELARGGQIYFVHNEVKSIEKVARDLTEVVPEARMRIAHGQMPERELEQAMLDFYHQRFNLLVCTTIIESGIDVPSANTILIHRADKLGMAQLHQLRGRVGRSHHRAYAYLIVPDRRSMTDDAARRLEAIAALEDLGVGFTLATHDMEIRGAGELLGEGQSGQIQEIGFTLYHEMLERAVKALRAGKIPNMDEDGRDSAEVEMRVAALLPEDYVPDVHTRLILYKRIANAADAAALRALQVELIDRFGLLPDAGKHLFQVTALRARCQTLGIQRLEADASGGRVVFGARPDIDPAQLIALIQSAPKTYRFDGKQILRFSAALGESEDRFDFCNALLDRLAGSARENRQ